MNWSALWPVVQSVAIASAAVLAAVAYAVVYLRWIKGQT